MPCLTVSKSSTRVALAMVLIASLASSALAGRGLFRNSAVGGVAIDARGVVSQPTQKAARHVAAMMKQQVVEPTGELAEATEMRRISLRKLSAAIKAAQASNQDLPDEIKYLAGMQRVQYVFVYPEQQDIVLAGPGEGWRVNEHGDVVGKTTGRPVLHLDDLLVALRTSQAAREVGVSCSIDPTKAGVQRMNALMRKQSRFRPGVLPQIEKAMGPQQVTITGVPEDSHFARVLVAADYRMKRIAMKLEQSPLRELPSFLDMMAHSRTKVTNMMPRWWLACDYEPMARTEDGLGWELRGPGVQVMTESEFVAEDGSRTATGKRGAVAKKWADTMTATYEELSERSPIFGQLRNLMDLSVIAAVIDKNQLAQEAGCDLSVLTGSDVVLDSWNAPKTISTQCSVTKRGREYLITASGGVQIESWQVADKSQVDPSVAKAYGKGTPSGNRWWQ